MIGKQTYAHKSNLFEFKKFRPRIYSNCVRTLQYCRYGAIMTGINMWCMSTLK